ncbi:MAG TPA: MASE1 domain-containing protein [Lysobacter sp.]|nr:MASE1 domain-containing protein [Lysobacter sp.]
MKPGRYGWTRNLLLMAGYGAGHALLFLPANVFWHPPAGWRFAFLALLPVRLWPWPFAAELLVFLSGSQNISRSMGSVALALLAFATHRALTSLGPLLLQCYPPLSADRPDSLMRLLAAMLVSALAATLFTVWWLPPLLEGPEAAMDTPLLFLQLLLGDFIGMLLFVPAALMLLRYRPSHRVLRNWRVDIPVVLAPSLAAYVVVASSAAQPVYFFATVLCFLPVIYFAFRTGWRGVSIALPVASIAVAVGGSSSDPTEPAQAQLLLAFTGSACLLLGASNDGLRAGRDALRRHNDQLLAANRKLDKTSEALKEAARRNLSLSEDIRRWITSELHDELGQNLTALQSRLKLVERKLGADETLLSIREIVGAMRHSVSGLLATLRPAGLDEFGLVQALERGSIRELIQTHGLAFSIRIEDQGRLLDGLDNDTQIAVYRIVQEAATNTVRHANARTFHVRLRARPTSSGPRILVAVGDDGSGLPASPRQGVGLQGIRDRVLSLGGRLHLSSDARGTRMLARFKAAGS